jgi:hypothetical protein
LVRPGNLFSGPVTIESQQWLKRDGQRWLETVFIGKLRLPAGGSTRELKFIQRVEAGEGKYCTLLAATTSYRFLQCLPLFTDALDGFHLQPQVSTAPDGQLVYAGVRLPYSLTLDRAWRLTSENKDFDLLFKLGNTCMFGVQAMPGAAPLTRESFAGILLNNFPYPHDGPVRELTRETQMLAGRKWLVLRLAWFKGSQQLTGFVAVRVGVHESFLMLGLTTTPLLDAAEIQRAMAGFAFD